MNYPNDVRPTLTTADGLTALRSTLCGRSVQSVFYRNLDSAPWPNGGYAFGSIADGNIDEVRLWVVVVLDNLQQVLIAWGTPDTDTGLCIRVESDYSASSDREATDVSRISRWSSVLGVPISGLGLAVYDPNGGGEVPWSLRIDFRDGSCAVLATGDLKADKSFFPVPDGLLVFHDARLARTYAPPMAGPSGAYGVDLPCADEEVPATG